MAMSFWPTADYGKIVDWLQLVEQNITAPSTGYTQLYDPGSFFDVPDKSTDPESTDPENPVMFATWGISGVEVSTPTSDPNTAGVRNKTIEVDIYCQRAGVGGSVAGFLLGLGSQYFAEMQAQSVTGLAIITQLLTWQMLPPEGDFSRARMSITLHLT